MNNVQPLEAFPADALARWQAAATDIDAADLFAGARSLGVVVPHADDETLGCGGLIAAAAAAGLAITVTILTDGAASHPGSRAWPPAALAMERQREARLALQRLGGDAVVLQFLGAPDGRLSETSGLDRLIMPADLYVTCWRDDPHPDHRAAFAIAMAAATRADVPLLAFPLWVLTTRTPVPDLPLFKLDVRDWLARKQAALAAHRSQLGSLIEDVTGFVLDAGLQRLFVRGDELFLRITPDEGCLRPG